MFVGASRERNTRRLERLLIAYALWDPPVGYCQGMADLMAPLLTICSRDYKVECACELYIFQYSYFGKCSVFTSI